MKIFIYIGVFALSSCASVPQKQRLTLPTRLFECLQEPIPPEINAESKDSEVALFIKDLAYAGRDCRSQLAEVGETLNLNPDIDVTDVLVTEEKPKSRWPWG